MVDLVDLAIFGFVCGALAMLVITDIPFSRTRLNVLLLMWVAVALLYFAALKRSRFRTPGYRVGRVRIIGMDGEPPSYGALVLRLMFVMLGPFNWVLDIFWLSDDVHRQALRDKFANTYVIKANARPAGRGKIVVQHCEILFYNFLCREVVADNEGVVEEPSGQEGQSGRSVPLEFASQERVNQHLGLKEDFVHRVVGLECAWISDESSLWDFHTEETHDSMIKKIMDVYGVDVSDIESGNIAQILERIASSWRQPEAPAPPSPCPT